MTMMPLRYRIPVFLLKAKSKGFTNDMTFYESVVFEIDSVLIDTLPAIRSLCSPADKKTDGKVMDEKLRSCLTRQNTGSPWEKTFAAGHGLVFKPTMNLTDEIISSCQPYEHVASLLESLKKTELSIGAISMLPAPLITEVLKTSDLSYYFDALICDDTDMPRSKDIMLSDCFETLRAAADRSVLIGAFPSSALAAWKSMTTFFASAYGFGFKDRSDALRFSPSFTVKSPDDLINLENHSVLLS